MFYACFSKTIMKKTLFFLLALILYGLAPGLQAQQKPNIIVIYADDLGYGDVSSYGATKIKTPNIDKLARQGLRFTNAYATSATCTPSRFSMLTGKYAWRKQGTGIAPGDAALLIPTNSTTLPGMLQQAGYHAGVIGKWHLGLGPKGGPDWNGDIKPGPLEIGFNYCFMLPSTGDRVPCVYMENHRIVDLDPADPIQVSYKGKVGNEPTGKENPEQLKMKFAHGHDQTIVNGVSRIGYMTGGKKARWIDEDMADVLTNRAINFIDKNKTKPFFLYFATHDIHVPRLPHSRFVGKSGMGPRGDAILQLDWTVGAILEALEERKLTNKTLVVFSSDNGPVINDGYHDEAVEKLGSHKPAGVLRGGKYSAFEAGTRVPFVVSWPGKIKPGVSHALISQVDLFASFASLTGQKLAPQDAPDSFNVINALLGKSKAGRQIVVQQSVNNTLSLVQGNWKYIEPGKGPKMNKNTQTELGNDPEPQLYNLKADLGERNNVAKANPAVVRQMEAALKAIRDNGHSRPL